MGNENSNNKRHTRATECLNVHAGECRPPIKCFKCGKMGHISRECDLVIVPDVKVCINCGEKHASSDCGRMLKRNLILKQRKIAELEKKVEKLEGQVDESKCGEMGHTSREYDLVVEPRVKVCINCGEKHASSNCGKNFVKNLQEEQRKIELEKKVEKLEDQVDKMLKLSEADEKRGASSNNLKDNSETKIPKDNSETNNNPFCTNSAPQLDSHNMNPAIFAGPPLQFNRPPPLMQIPTCSQPQNNPPFNQSPNQPFPNLVPNNFTRPPMNPLPFPNIQLLQPQVQQTFQKPHPNVQPTPGYNHYQQSFPNNQNAQSKFYNNNSTDSPQKSDQTTQFKKPFQNQPNRFNQKQNTEEANQQRRGNNRGRGGFNRGGNSAGWKNHNDNSNWKNNNNRNRNFNSRGRGIYNRGNDNMEPQLFSGGKSNQTKTDKAEGNVPNSEKNQTGIRHHYQTAYQPDRKDDDANNSRTNRNHQGISRGGIHKERKGVDGNDLRTNRNHQGVYRGGIHKERVNIKGRGIHKVEEPNKKDNNSNCDSDSTGTSLETAPNTTEQQKKRRGNRRKKEEKESSNDSAESTSDKKPEEVRKEDKENQPLSKNNLGEGDILMKYIGTKLPKITDAITDNVSLYQKVEGVMLMSDPTSDEPILEPAKNLLHIIEFKGLHPKAKSFFC